MKSHILSFISVFALFTLMACGDSSSPDQVPPNQTPHTQQQQPVPLVSFEDQQITQLGTFGDLNAEQIQAILANRESIKAELLRRLTAHDLETLNQLLSQTPGITPVQTYASAFLAMHIVDYAAALAAARDAAEDVARVASGEVARYAAWNTSLAAAWAAARNANRDSAWAAAGVFIRYYAAVGTDAERRDAADVAYDAARPLIIAGLRVLHLEDTQEIGRTGYALSELLTLNWFLQNNRIYFVNAFNSTRVGLGAGVTLEQAREIVHGAIGPENLNTNPFIMQMRSFMTGVDQRITTLPLQ